MIPEEEKLIERMARALADADGLWTRDTPDGSWEAFGIDTETGEEVVFKPAQFTMLARGHYAMRKAMMKACPHPVWTQIQIGRDVVIYQCDECGKVSEEPNR